MAESKEEKKKMSIFGKSLNPFVGWFIFAAAVIAIVGLSVAAILLATL